jgi:zinc transport system ATP-binding protein
MKYISLRNINVFYDQKQVLEAVNLDIDSNDFIGVIGPNGGGKTTLMKTILKQISFEGVVEYHKSDLKIGYMPQLQNVDKSFPISLLDVVVSGLQLEKGITGRYRREDYKRAEVLLEMAGIKNIRTKCLRSNNVTNVVKATFEGLKALRTAEEVAALRGLTVDELK